ncbi:MAG: hypothetical protein QM775_08380 [Pirellulales bacterium]
MGYADDGSLYFCWPAGKTPETSRIVAPPAAGTNGVSIQCSHIDVIGVTAKYAANDGFNIHGAVQRHPPQRSRGVFERG